MVLNAHNGMVLGMPKRASANGQQNQEQRRTEISKQEDNGRHVFRSKTHTLARIIRRAPCDLPASL
jgi:hypothetical protein